jgi:hypothetical protein
MASRHQQAPAQRAAWHAAYAAMNGTDAAIDGATDGTLLNMRAAYERETAWAPPHVADVLRQYRLGQQSATWMEDLTCSINVCDGPHSMITGCDCGITGG